MQYVVVMELTAQRNQGRLATALESMSTYVATLQSISILGGAYAYGHTE